MICKTLYKIFGTILSLILAVISLFFVSLFFDNIVRVVQSLLSLMVSTKVAYLVQEISYCEIYGNMYRRSLLELQVNPP